MFCGGLRDKIIDHAGKQQRNDAENDRADDLTAVFEQQTCADVMPCDAEDRCRQPDWDDCLTVEQEHDETADVA